jgi:DNA modification methylase
MDSIKEIVVKDKKLKVHYVPIFSLRSPEYNPRKWSKEATIQLEESVKKYGLVDPLIVNSAPNRKGIIIGGSFRWAVARELKLKEVPVVYIKIPSIEKEKELNLRLNKNTGDWDWNLLANFGEDFLSEIGFSSKDLDEVFGIDETPEEFDLTKELQKLSIQKIEIQKGNIYELGPHRLMCGDSTVEKDILKLMDGEKADMCLTDSPYILDYLHTKYKGKGSGFGFKRNRRYLETDFLPPNFTEKWMANVHKVQKDDFSIIAFENWKNIRLFWNEMEKFWRIKNMIVWFLPTRTQGFASRYRFFSKHDIAMVGTSENVTLNLKNEDELLQNEYEIALYAISGKPHWEGYEKGKKICPTDHIEFKADDAKHSGQGIIFGCKPIEILIPYIKVLTKRNDLIIDCFGGSGSSLIAAEKMKRRCYMMEKVPIYCEVIKRRWEKLTGQKAKKL